MVKNKKGTIQDLVLIMVIIIFFAIGTLIVYKISDELNTQFQESEDINDEGKVAFDSINNMFPNVIDNTFLLLIFGLGIGALILAFLVRVHPVFFVGFLLVLVIIIFVSGVFSNIYLEIANTDDFVGVAANLTFITHIIGKLPLIIGILGFLISIVMYKQFQAAQ